MAGSWKEQLQDEGKKPLPTILRANRWTEANWMCRAKDTHRRKHRKLRPRPRPWPRPETPHMGPTEQVKAGSQVPLVEICQAHTRVGRALKGGGPLSRPGFMLLPTSVTSGC